MIHRELSRHNPGPSGAPCDPRGAAEGSFRREGEYWTIVYRGTLVRLRDAKGLRYIAHLLSRPGEPVQAHHLLATATTIPRSVMSCPEPLTDSMVAERARLAVTKRIKSAIRLIDIHAPELGYHLTVTIKTGSRCVYRADPQRPVRWALEE